MRSSKRSVSQGVFPISPFAFHLEKPASDDLDKVSFMTPVTKALALTLALTMSLVGCATGYPTELPAREAEVSGQEETLTLGLESACKSVEELVAQTPEYFPGATKPDETDSEKSERREPFQAQLASMSAVLATIPQDSSSEEIIESLEHSAAAALHVVEGVSGGGEEFDASGLQRLFDVEIWGEPLKDWHSSAQSSSRLCVENQFSSVVPDELGENSQFFDLLPFGAWDYQASEDDFGVVRHNWSSAATTNEPFPVGNLSLFIICWGDQVVLGPSPRPYTADAFGAYAIGRNSQGVEIALGDGQGIWQTSVVDGTTIGLYPAEKEADFRTGSPDLQSRISKESIEEFMKYETVSIGTEFSVGEISGKNYVRGLERVIQKMEQLGCW